MDEEKTDVTNETGNSILNKINEWSISDNPFAKVVRFFAKTLYSGGVLVGGLVTGITNTILGRDIVNRELDYDHAVRADRNLKDIMKAKVSEKEKDIAEDSKKEEHSNDCAKMNHDTFAQDIRSEFSENMYKDLGLSVIYNKNLQRLDFYMDDDKKMILGSLTEEQYINGVSAPLADVVLNRMLHKDGLGIETLPDDMLQEYQNKANLYAAIMQGGMFLAQNGENLKTSYEQYCRKYGEDKNNAQFLLQNYCLSRSTYTVGATKHLIEVAYEPHNLNGFSLYRNGQKIDTFNLEEIRNGKLYQVTENIVHSLQETIQSVQERQLQFGDVTIQKSGDHELLLANEKKGIAYKMPVSNSEIMVSGIRELQKTDMFKGSSYEKKISALVTVVSHTLDISFENKSIEASSVTDGRLLNTVTGKYEAISDISYSMRKEKDTLMLVEYQKEPVWKMEYSFSAYNEKQIIREFHRQQDSICDVLLPKTETEDRIQDIMNACSKTAGKCVKEPYVTIEVEGQEEFALRYNKADSRMEIYVLDGYQNKECLTGKFNYEKAGAREMDQFIEVLGRQKFSPAKSVLAKNPVILEALDMHEMRDDKINESDIQPEFKNDPILPAVPDNELNECISETQNFSDPVENVQESISFEDESLFWNDEISI